LKRTILLTFALLVVFSAISVAATRPALADYVENQIIVKFRKSVTDTLKPKPGDGLSSSELRLSRSLERLNKKYRLRKAKPLFKNFRKNRQHLNSLLKKNRALLTSKEDRILRRLKRNRKNAKVPALDRIYMIDIDLEAGQSLQDVVAAYNNDPDVEYAELNYVVSICKTPNDPLYPIQWPLNNTGQMYPESGRYNPPPGTADSDVDGPQAWNIETGSSEIIVAVVDTGVDYTHRDIDDNMWLNNGEIPGNGLDDDDNGYIDDMYGYDFRNYDSNPKDDHGHGTHCAGIIAAEGNNGLDVTGLCWNAKIMAIKFLNSSGSGNTSDAIEAFYYAVDNGADVISNSWGGADYSQTMKDAIDYAYSQGAIIVASAGNNNSTYPNYPAYYDHVISVAATDSRDQKASFSNYGDWVDIAAPGVDVLSLRASGTSMGTVNNSYTTVSSGTSMACPHVAGACALLLSFFPQVRVDELEQSLIETTDPVTPEIFPWGRLNAHQAAMDLFGPQGRIYLESDFYSCSDLIEITLLDSDLQTNSSQQVTVTTDGGDFETVVIGKMDVLGVFKGTISTDSGTANTEDGILQVFHDEIITATYEDEDDGTGDPATSNDTAIIDCVDPMIFNVQIDPRGPEPNVTFETDELSTARVLCGQACGGPYTIEKNSLSLLTSHSIKLRGVSPNTDYFFLIEVADRAGNRIVDDNTGLCYPFTTTSDEIYVPADYNTIQEAIKYSWYDRGTIWVADGIHTGDGNRDIDFMGKGITLRSENGPENCIIDCNGSSTEPHRGFIFFNDETADSVVDGFTITKGYVVWNGPAAQFGGGIYCYGSSPTITNCYITQNTAEFGAGGGICCINSNAIIRNCVVSDNLARGAGGIYCIYDSNMKIINSVISGNIADAQSSGGIYVDDSDVTVNNCTIVGNRTNWYGGGIRCYYYANATVTNSIIRGNEAILGGSQIALLDVAAVTTSFCDVQGGEDGVYTENQCTVNWGQGNIDIDPFFADPCSNDYHLLPGSRCIHAGDPAYVPGNNETDLDGSQRVIAARIDMGAYEFSGLESRLSFIPATINRHRRMKKMMAWVHLPRGITKDQIDKDQPVLLYPGAIEPIRQYVLQSGRSNHKRAYVIAFYDRDDLMTAVPGSGTVDIQVIGSLNNGRYFYGSDSIRMAGPRSHLR